MKLTRKQKLAAVFLGVCLFGLLLDRTLFAPSSAEALPIESSPPGSVGEVADLAEEATPTASVHDRFGRHLRALAEDKRWDRDVTRDAFAPATSWPGLEPDDTRPVIDPTQVSGMSLAEAFRLSHELNAVMASAGGGYALVNGTMVLVGREVGGFTLVKVENRSATFERKGEQVTLDLSGEDTSQP